jgi:hypothetical protein
MDRFSLHALLPVRWDIVETDGSAPGNWKWLDGAQAKLLTAQCIEAEVLLKLPIKDSLAKVSLTGQQQTRSIDFAEVMFMFVVMQLCETWFLVGHELRVYKVVFFFSTCTCL